MLRQFSNGPKNHFFGYYGINPWDQSRTYHLALETDFHDSVPTITDIAKVGVVHRETGDFIPLASTSAFNLQQGSMMHWINVGLEEEFTYNDWEGDRLVSRAINPETRASRTIEGAVAAVSLSTPYAIGLNFARMSVCREVVGYANRIDPVSWTAVPAEDGLFLIDLRDGSAELVLSVATVIDQSNLVASECGLTWFNHVMFNPSGSRIFFFCRSRPADASTIAGFQTSLWTVNPDGTDLQCQIPFGHKISHFAWRDDQRMLMSTSILDRMQFIEFTDNKHDFEPVGDGKLPKDGHACYSPDGRWLVCDTYPDRHTRASTLMLYHLATGEKIVIGSSFAEPKFTGAVRCDLHPRWSPDGKSVTIDSVDRGDRQIYMADLSQSESFLRLS
ncbi:MAG: hypothetical protein QGI86_13105 [Candidatus Poribacteria bacterium]|jgi:hypothetical protein|nr:hypothetical protein [Candidatus Poribacteria bacterium]MDP6747734.1 hypothetical protein [Candidatus Poribacteria bacterium]MDP6996499.1 hypothetical protein [Candidatus Poribacteria bacterium]